MRLILTAIVVISFIPFFVVSKASLPFTWILVTVTVRTRFLPRFLANLRDIERGIVDAGADTTLMGDAFEVLSHSARTVEVHGYNGARGAERGLYIATGVTMVDLPDGTALMLQFNEAVDMGSGKSLISSNQVRHHNNSVYDTPKRYGGLQCIVLGDWFNTIIPLEYKDGLCLMNIRKPTKWELANKQPTHVTCSLPWNPSITESDSIDPQDLVNHAAEYHGLDSVES